MVPRGRIIEAELWGVHKDLHEDDGLCLRAMMGAYGTLYELEISSSWALWRASEVLAGKLPTGVELVVFDEDTNEDEELDGVTVVHYWKDKGKG